MSYTISQQFTMVVWRYQGSVTVNLFAKSSKNILDVLGLNISFLKISDYIGYFKTLVFHFSFTFLNVSILNREEKKFISSLFSLIAQNKAWHSSIIRYLNLGIDTFLLCKTNTVHLNSAQQLSTAFYELFVAFMGTLASHSRNINARKPLAIISPGHTAAACNNSV